jgi:hypothetical protein
MSWASRRNTTRVEDIAYCLLGIFSVNMALLYGEGERAFIRLQEEIMKTSDDDSLFAWAAKDSDLRKSRGLLVSSPGEFQEAGSISSCHDWTKSSLPYAMTNKGLLISLSLNITAEQNVYLALLNCLATNYNNGTLAIYLKRLSLVGDQYVRVHPNKVATFNGNRSTSTETIYVRQRTPLRNLESFGQEQQFLIQTDVSVPALGYVLSTIDTPTGLMPLDGDILAKGLPIPKGSNGWVAALGYRHKSPENKNKFWVLLGSAFSIVSKSLVWAL